MEFINVKFHYNGNLGILQQKTIDNKIFCGKLLQNGVITRDERKVLMEEITRNVMMSTALCFFQFQSENK